MSNPLVSVIVLTYNSASTICQTLDSVLSQQCDFEFEVVVGDDCSSDGTQQLLVDYARRYSNIRLRLAETNQGVQANYYGCLEAAAGEFIADCAGDDYWYGTDRLQKMIAALVANPHAAFVHTDWYCRLEPEGTLSHAVPACNRDMEPREALPLLLSSVGRPAVHLSAAVYRKSVLMPVYAECRDLFLDRSYGCEDLQLLVSLAARGSSLYMPFVSLVYRVGHSAAITSGENAGKSARFALSTARLRLRLQRMYGLYGDPSAGSSLAQLSHYALSQAIISGDRNLVRDISSFIGTLKKDVPLSTRLISVISASGAGLWIVRFVKRLLQKLRNRK